MPIDRNNLTDLLSRLVACASVNPDRRETTAGQFGEGELADLLASIVQPWGAETRKVEFAPGRFNFIARFDGRDSARSLMFEAHADTVSVEGMSIDPFDPVVRDGRLYGRGACDTKGAMAAMLLAIRTVLDETGRPPVTVYFVATGDEELGCGGAYELVGEGFTVNAAIVGEPTDLRIVYAHKGACRFAVTTAGRAAHSSDPSQGVNAIAQMARIVQCIEGPLAERLSRVDHPVLGPPTVSVGLIRGGTQVNVVPAHCQIEVDRRYLPGETREQIEDELRRELDRLPQAAPPLDYTLSGLQWYPALEDARQGEPGEALANACRKVLGQPAYATVPWATNAGVFQGAGIPSLVFGPGSIKQAHTAVEYVEIEAVAKAAEVYAEAIRNFACPT